MTNELDNLLASLKDVDVDISKLVDDYISKVVVAPRPRSRKERARIIGPRGCKDWIPHPPDRVPRDPLFDKPFPQYTTDEQAVEWASDDEFPPHDHFCPGCWELHQSYQILRLRHLVRCKKCGYTAFLKPGTCSLGCLTLENFKPKTRKRFLRNIAEKWELEKSVVLVGLGHGVCCLRHPAIPKVPGFIIPNDRHWYFHHPTRWNNLPIELDVPAGFTKSPPFSAKWDR